MIFSWYNYSICRNVGLLVCWYVCLFYTIHSLLTWTQSIIFYVDWDSQPHHYFMLNGTHILYYGILWKCNLCWLGLTTHHNFILTWTHIFDHDISKEKILCWLGLTKSSSLYVDLHSHLWSWYFKKTYSMLTGTHNISLLRVDLYSHLLLWYILEIYSMLTETHKLENYIQCNHIPCWLGLTTSWLHHVDLDSHLWS